jgi:uncharacterized protein YacL
VTGSAVARIVVAVVLATLGGLIGVYFADQLGLGLDALASGGVGAAAGAVLGALLAPVLVWRPFLALHKRFRQAPAQQLVAGVVGLVIGLVIAALVSYPLSLLPTPFRQVFPILAAVLFGFLGTLMLVTRHRDIFQLFRGRGHKADKAVDGEEGVAKSVLLDTSVIIDGRIADIGATGFIAGRMLVPNFVLNELQHIADSPDALRRNRGRRGLDILGRLQSEAVAPVTISDLDVEGMREVDEKLVVLAKQLDCPIVTNDYNLNRVAELQGVRVLNINELANAVRAVFIPGESLVIRIIQEGKEIGQGVGYLEDGTMVVVEDGGRFIDRDMRVIVTKVLQTSAGRMLFARLSD